MREENPNHGGAIFGEFERIKEAFKKQKIAG
jgi:hypothetical protein